MATSKTLTPTNVTIQIPEFTDQPDQRVNSNCIDKEADAINSLNAAIGTLNDNITELKPNSYLTTGLSFATGVSLGAGGYFKIGNVCIVNMRLSITGTISANNNIVSGLPSEKSFGVIYIPVTSYPNGNDYYMTAGAIRRSSAQGSDVIFVSCVYLLN